MFVLDTNILSALMQLARVPEIASWMTAQDENRLFTTTISQAEILAGLAVMPDGRRRRAFEEAAGMMFGDFSGRILSFDIAAAGSYATLFATRQKIGRPAAPLDVMIAAIARAHGASVVTRDTGGFEGCGLTIINPWNLSTDPKP